jgi:hypothetical protein
VKARDLRRKLGFTIRRISVLCSHSACASALATIPLPPEVGYRARRCHLGPGQFWSRTLLKQGRRLRGGFRRACRTGLRCA